MSSIDPVGGAARSVGTEFRLGWPTIVGSLLCYALSVAAIPVYLQGLFITDLQQEFGWTRAQISLGGTVQLALLAVMAPIAGYAADRLGMRIPIGFSLVGISVVYAAMSSLHSYPMFLMLQALLPILGAASLPVVFTRAVNSWFNTARGLALGTTLIGTGLTATFGPRLVTGVIVDHGWRTGYLAISAAVLLLAPLVVWLVRLAPWEQSGAARAVTETEALGPDVRPGFEAAVRQPLFWILAATFFLQAVALVGMNQHITPLMLDQQVPRTEAASIAGLLGVGVIFGRFVTGALMDRLFAPWVGAGAIGICIAGFLALALGGSSLAPFAAGAIGFGVGAEVDVISFLTSRYFADRAYARLYGLLYSIFLLGAALSPLWIGAAFDLYLSYGLALYVCVGLLIAAALILVFLPRYHPPLAIRH